MKRYLSLGVAALAVALAGGLAAAGPAAAQTSSAPNVVYQKSVAVRTIAGKASYHTTVGVGVVLPGVTPATTNGIVSGDQKRCVDDSGVSVENCVQMNYSAQPCASNEEYCFDVTSSDLYYTNLGGTQVTLVSGDWVEGVNGPCYYNCGSSNYYSGTHDWGTHSVVSGQQYAFPGAWIGKYIAVNAGRGDNHGGHNTLLWNFRGVRQSPLTVTFNLGDTP